MKALASMGGQVGRGLATWLGLIGQWSDLWYRTVRLAGRGRLDLQQILQQVDAVGVGSLPMACLTVTFSAMVLALYTVDMMRDYGFGGYVGLLVGQGVMKEIGPLVTAIVVASREGSRIAAEIAAMKVTEQLDALRALATDPVEYLVIPRYVGAVLAMPMLTLLASAAGILGGYLVSLNHGIPTDVYWSSVMRWVGVAQVLSGMVKGLLFGAIIATIACRTGLSAGHGASAVGGAVTKSVVLCVLVVHVADYCLATVFG